MALLACEILPLTIIDIIDGELPITDIHPLSKDQTYLLKISQAMRGGNCSEEPAK